MYRAYGLCRWLTSQGINMQDINMLCAHNTQYVQLMKTLVKNGRPTIWPTTEGAWRDYVSEQHAHGMKPREIKFKSEQLWNAELTDVQIHRISKKESNGFMCELTNNAYEREELIRLVCKFYWDNLKPLQIPYYKGHITRVLKGATLQAMFRNNSKNWREICSMKPGWADTVTTLQSAPKLGTSWLAVNKHIKSADQCRLIGVGTTQIPRLKEWYKERTEEYIKWNDKTAELMESMDDIDYIWDWLLHVSLYGILNDAMIADSKEDDV